MTDRTREIQEKLVLPEGMYKTINCIRDNVEDEFSIYELDRLGLVKLVGWNGNEYAECFKIDSSGEVIENLNMILKPRCFALVDVELFENDEPIYFYCK